MDLILPDDCFPFHNSYRTRASRQAIAAFLLLVVFVFDHQGAHAANVIGFAESFAGKVCVQTFDLRGNNVSLAVCINATQLDIITPFSTLDTVAGIYYISCISAEYAPVINKFNSKTAAFLAQTELHDEKGGISFVPYGITYDPQTHTLFGIAFYSLKRPLVVIQIDIATGLIKPVISLNVTGFYRLVNSVLDIEGRKYYTLHAIPNTMTYLLCTTDFTHNTTNCNIPMPQYTQILAMAPSSRLYAEDGLALTLVDPAQGKVSVIGKFPQGFVYGATAAVDHNARNMYMWIYDSDVNLSMQFGVFDLLAHKFSFVRQFTAGYYFGLALQP